ncbi:hypothetical protein Cva_00580 [Caedimonas varicaedens]|uniref:Uncharacterized protein n=1 Tax=Caedimonas varicaedens TaxID=1629334 RepID=A0A0K8MCL0_9PROT|nr:hypothetical protein Cva_00580 [Caedimonas varicaedens]
MTVLYVVSYSCSKVNFILRSPITEYWCNNRLAILARLKSFPIPRN